jgi:hypothetical protein
MITADVQLRWIEFRQYILNWQSKRQSNQLAQVNLVRERSINILQNRYGYSKEQAKSELSKHYSKALLY